MENSKVDVIIPVLDRKEETIKTLRSLFENNSNIDVIIVDNGSKEIGYLSDFEVRIIKNKNNLGTVKAVNQGLEISKSKYIVIMHNDIVINIKDCIIQSIRFMEINPDIGIVGISGWKKIERNGIPNWSTAVTSIDKYRKKPKENFEEVGTLDGCCMIIKNLDLRVDENYGLMHFYDLDLSMQYRQRGYRLFVINGSAQHFANDSKKSTRANESYLKKIGMNDNQYYEKNRKIFLDKWKNYLPIAV